MISVNHIDVGRAIFNEVKHGTALVLVVKVHVGADVALIAVVKVTINVI